MVRRPRPEGATAALVLAAILLIGGAGASYPLLNGAVELLAVGLLAWVASRRQAAITGLEWALIALTVALPAAQLVPLPIDWWQALPGRALPGEVLTATGLRPPYLPLTLARGETLHAALALLPGLALFAAARSLTAAGRRLAVQVVVAMAAASACLGAVQVTTGVNGPGFASAHAGQAIGLFVNRNHQAALLLIALCLLPAALYGTRRSGARLGISALLTAGVVATTSRTGLALLPFCLMPTLWPWLRRRGRAALAVGALCIVLALIGWGTGVLPRLLARFGEPELRPAFWQTTWAAMRSSFPAGTGLGTFKSVYPLVERREALEPFFVNHAHDDYLELLLEGGAAAAAGLALFAVWLGGRLRAAWRGADPVPGALGGIGVLLVYTAVDYPLRTLSLMAVFGLLCGLAGEAAAHTKRVPSRWRVGIALLVAVGLSAAATGQAIARHVLAAGEPRRAVVFDPWLAAGWTALAAQDIAGAHRAEAAADAQRALLLRPLDQQALGVWAAATDAQGGVSTAAWTAAARLGWRDPLTQLRLTARFADAGNPRAALARADAALRQGQADPVLVAALRLGSADPRFARALAGVLDADPPWRAHFMLALNELDASQVAGQAALLAAMTTARPEERAALIARASAVGRDDVAARAWAGLGTDDNLLPDPGINRLDGTGIGGWRRSALPGLETADGGLVLERSVAGVLLDQDLFLAPGSYALAADFGADGPLADTLRWTVTCVRGDRRLDAGEAWTASSPTRAALRLAITVPADCPRQRLALSGEGSGVGTVRLTARLRLVRQR